LAEEEREINILKHELVPEHTIMTPEQVKEVLTKLAINLTQLPKILTTDPVVKAVGAKAGDVLRIERRSPTAGKTTYYRLVAKESA
jgi:DNA-directed RNA polymerase subunit H